MKLFPTSRSPWLPSLSTALWLAFFLSLTLSGWRTKLISADADPCWHWAQGNWMLEHHEVMRTDVFSHTRTGAPVVGKEWLSQVFYAIAGNALGWNGFVLLAAALIATTLWILHRLLLAEGTDLVLATLLVLLAASNAVLHWLARPHLWTHLMVVIFVWQLRWFDRDRLGVKPLFLTLVPAMMLWANLHGAFLTGFVLIGTYGIGAACRQDGEKFTVFVILGIACALVTLINPYGWHLHEHIINFLRTPYQAFFTDEWKSANFHETGMRGFLLQLLLLGFILLVVRPKWRATDLLLVASWAYFGLESVRNAPVFAFVVTPIFAEQLNGTGWFQRISTNITAVNQRADGRITAGVAVLAVLLVVGKTNWIQTGLPASQVPVGAVKFLKTHPKAVRGEMFNDYDWGGFLIRYLPERKVFIDGRNDFYGAPFLREFSTVDKLQPGWEGVLEKYKVGWTLLPRKHPLSNLLALRNDWKLVYQDAVASIYVR
jgi:hypothetical protein